MTRHVARAYAAAGAVLVLFAAWAVIAAHPWSAGASAADPRLAALRTREARLRHEAVVVGRTVRHRWAVYRAALARRHAQIAAAERIHRSQVAGASLAGSSAAGAGSSGSSAAPAVRVVTLPPVTITRTS